MDGWTSRPTHRERAAMNGAQIQLSGKDSRVAGSMSGPPAHRHGCGNFNAADAVGKDLRRSGDCHSSSTSTDCRSGAKSMTSIAFNLTDFSSRYKVRAIEYQSRKVRVPRELHQNSQLRRSLKEGNMRDVRRVIFRSLLRVVGVLFVVSAYNSV